MVALPPARRSWFFRNVNSRFSALLLAGGRSTRMGRDKAFIENNGELLWERQLRILRELEPDEVFIAGPPHDVWRASGAEIVADARGNAGPLAGLVAGLRRCDAPLLLALAVDLPNITGEYLTGLLHSCDDRAGVVPVNAGKFEPLVAIYPRVSLDLAENCLRDGQLSLQNFADRAVSSGLVKTQAVNAGDLRLFLNMNTPADLAAVAPGSAGARVCNPAAAYKAALPARQTTMT